MAEHKTVTRARDAMLAACEGFGVPLPESDEDVLALVERLRALSCSIDLYLGMKVIHEEEG